MRKNPCIEFFQLQQTNSNYIDLKFLFQVSQCQTCRKWYPFRKFYRETLNFFNTEHCSTQFSSLYLNLQTAMSFFFQILTDFHLFHQVSECPKLRKKCFFSAWSKKNPLVSNIDLIDLKTRRLKSKIETKKVKFFCGLRIFIYRVSQCRNCRETPDALQNALKAPTTWNTTHKKSSSRWTFRNLSGYVIFYADFSCFLSILRLPKLIGDPS